MRLPVTPGSYEPGSLGQAGLRKGPAMKPAMQTEKCDQCLACWIFCPDSALTVTAAAVALEARLCKGCGICAAECRNGAITMVEVA